MSVIQDIRDAFSRRDNVLNQLIIANALVWVLVIVLRAIFRLTQLDDTYALLTRQLVLSSNGSVLLRHPWTLLTYAFTHEDFFHILFNMLNLYWFGQLVREYLGNNRLVSLYVLGSLAGAALFLLGYNFLPALQPLAAAGQLLGASAAVTAIIVGAATLLPDYTFMIILLGPVKIKWIAVVVVLISIAGLNGGNPGGMLAHLGGALLGFVFVKQLKGGRDLGQPVQAVGSWVGLLFERKPAMTVTHRGGSPAPRPAASKAPAGSPPTEDVDAILDKISRSGYESLSKEEKQKLFRASQQ